MTGDDLSWRFVLRSQRELHMNCQQFAELTGTTEKWVKNWRSGLYQPTCKQTLVIVSELRRQRLLDDVLTAKGRG